MKKIQGTCCRPSINVGGIKMKGNIARKINFVIFAAITLKENVEQACLNQNQ